MSVRAWQSKDPGLGFGTARRTDRAVPRAGSPVGQFRYHCASDTWWWSDELFAIHGLKAGETLLTTKLILALTHPEDAHAAETALRATARSGAAFALPHRIVTARGDVRQVITVGAGVPGGDRVVAVGGFTLDLTNSGEAVVEDEAWELASQVIERRAAIERAKGALMAVHGIGEQEAFAVLRRLSNRQNLKLRDVAAWLLEEFRSHADSTTRPATTRPPGP